jgi:hypothetical protein
MMRALASAAALVAVWFALAAACGLFGGVQ